LLFFFPSFTLFSFPFPDPNFSFSHLSLPYCPPNFCLSVFFRYLKRQETEHKFHISNKKTNSISSDNYVLSQPPSIYLTCHSQWNTTALHH
jgi:hypothetical protein